MVGSAVLAGLTACFTINRLTNWQVGIITFFVFVFGMVIIYGCIYLVNLIHKFEILGKIKEVFKAVKIEIQDYNIPSQMAAENLVELKLILKVNNPPKQLGELKLCLSHGEIDPIYPDLSSVPLRLVDKVNYVMAKYQIRFGIWRQSVSRKSPDICQMKYHIKAQVDGKRYISKEHTLDNCPFF